MKIKKIMVWREDLELTRPYTIAYETVSSVENVFVYLETESGIVGIGAGSPAEDVTGETMAACEKALNDNLENILQGKDIRYFSSLLQKLNTDLAGTPAAMAAADIALHDLMANKLGLPLADILGRVHDTLPTSITIGIKSLEETLAGAEEYLGRGFSILKVKTGLDVNQDIEHILRLDEEFKSQILIRVDANQGYGIKESRLFFEKTLGLVEFIEQPMKAGDIDGSLDLARDIVEGGFTMENGWMRTTDQPGLGVKKL